MAQTHTASQMALTVSESSQTAEKAPVQDQFVELLTANWDRAYRFAYHLTGNAQEAEDLLQEAAEEAFRAFGRFQSGTRFDRWLLRIMHNSFLDRVRRDRRRRVFSLEDVSVDPLTADRFADPAVVAEGMLDGAILRALNALPSEYRAPVVLVDLQGFAYEEAAEILHCPVGTIRSRLHRGRLALREWLRPYVDAMKRGDL